jgi:hypothetical protein
MLAGWRACGTGLFAPRSDATSLAAAAGRFAKPGEGAILGKYTYVTIHGYDAHQYLAGMSLAEIPR